MSELKTKATRASVADYIAARANDEQRADCKALMSLFARLTGHKPRMWGPSIVGYGSHRYTTAGGKSPGEMPIGAFAIRGRDLVIYIMPDVKDRAALLQRLGKHSIGKSCLYFRRLADLDPKVLERLLVNSIEGARRSQRSA